MKLFTKGLVGILGGLLLTGCATTSQLDFSAEAPARLARFANIERVAPPVGALEFCEADAHRCGAEAVRYFREHGTSGTATSTTPALGGVNDASKESQRAAFQYLLAAKQNEAEAQHVALTDQKPDDIVVSAAGSAAIQLTPELWAQLKEVQSRINASIRPATDMQVYGKDEYWALPLEATNTIGSPRGDCEDFALEKRKALLALGWSPQSMSIVTAISPAVGMHAVLVVTTDRGEFVLDNLEAHPRLASELPYNWMSRQTGADMMAWSRIALRVTNQDRPEMLFASLMQERIQRAAAYELSTTQNVTVAASRIYADSFFISFDQTALRTSTKGRVAGFAISVIRMNAFTAVSLSGDALRP